ncbi:MAG: mechanosensitive ion channel family protein [Desulfarculaceae bacterium]|nr:mechanosensitive ion channel family protein [Desulfarculaceae bacterium]MCF8070787.1 mechanosensitive ion channel family protein [Desulfarculaceae bacterium]MCF8102224.1 mechanosensitive ion channel family protein [Desulfarculaceae bacterium]MCF8116977.1 mechanosensitive ion channel family protein [Desulfarculaceae bacterium]
MRLICSLFLCLALVWSFAPPCPAKEVPTLKQVITPAQGQKAEGQKAQAKAKPAPAKPVPPAQARPSPRRAINEYLQAVGRGDYKAASAYLDLSRIPAGQRDELGPRLAYRLVAAGARTMLLDKELISDNPRGDLKDGLPPDLEKIATVSTPEGPVDLYLHRQRSPEGEFVWRFTPRSVSQIDQLYRHFGLGLLGEKLTEYLPHYWFLGMQLWQWAAGFLLIVVCYLAAWLVTAIIEQLLKRRPRGLSDAGGRFLRGPFRLLVAALLFSWNVDMVGPSLTVLAIMRGRAFLLIAVTWCVVRTVDIAVERLAAHMLRMGNQQATVLLKPVGTIVKVLVIMTAGVLWLDNLGFKVTTILASLGVGGIAMALAAQDTLKNFLGSIAILLDKPFRVGERIVVQGHDGFVEEIGLRSTKLRQLDGHQAVVPNELVARVNIENVGRRPHIRRVANLRLASRTSAAKARRAVKIVEELLQGHQCLDPGLPPRVYLNEFNPDSLNLLMIYWYIPPDFWAYNAFGNQLNLSILERFEQEGIRLAEPVRRNLIGQEPERAPENT